jgi:hypothetical protein
VPVQKSGKMKFRDIQKLDQWCHKLISDSRCQSLNEHLLIIVIFGRTSPASKEKIDEKFYFYAACLRASVSKLADTMEAQT